MIGETLPFSDRSEYSIDAAKTSMEARRALELADLLLYERSTPRDGYKSEVTDDDNLRITQSFDYLHLFNYDEGAFAQKRISIELLKRPLPLSYETYTINLQADYYMERGEGSESVGTVNRLYTVDQHKNGRMIGWVEGTDQTVDRGNESRPMTTFDYTDLMNELIGLRIWQQKLSTPNIIRDQP